MDYVAVFDVIEGGYREWRTPAFGLAFTAVGIVLLLVRRHVARGLPVGASLVVISALWTASVFTLTFFDYKQLASALQEGRCQVVEGRVTNFDPMPESGHKNESFVVSRHRFIYSDYTLGAGFHNARSHGGPIRDGIYVRIYYYGEEIARLEIAR